MSRTRNRPVAHFGSWVAFSVVLCDPLWPLCCAFRNLTQRTQRKATEGTEALAETVR
jgi:hypothetical protein